MSRAPYPARRRSYRDRVEERRWIRALDDRELGRVSRALTAVDRAVKRFREREAA